MAESEVKSEVGVVLREKKARHRRRSFLALLTVAPAANEPPPASDGKLRPVRARLASEPVSVVASLVKLRSEVRRASEPTLVPTTAVRLPARRAARNSTRLLLAKILGAWVGLVKRRNEDRELLRTVNERIRQCTRSQSAGPMRVSRLRRLETQSERRIHSQRRQEEQEELWRINRIIARDRDNRTSNVKPRPRQPTLFAGSRVSPWVPMKQEHVATLRTSSSASSTSSGPTRGDHVDKMVAAAVEQEKREIQIEQRASYLVNRGAAVVEQEAEQAGPLLSARQRFRDRGAIRQPLRRSKARRGAVHELTEETLRAVAARALREPQGRRHAVTAWC